MKTHRFVFLVGGLALIAIASLPMPAASNWPQWRGPDGQGHALGSGYPLKWSETEGVVWRTPLPGRGWSSPVIWGNQIWLTMALEVAAAPEKAAERLKSNTNDQPLTLLDEVKLHALCVDRESGKLLHDIELITQREPQWVHQLNSYASPTPLIEDGRVYCHFGTFGTACVDTASGAVVWRNTDLHLMHENGPGSSPVLWKDHVIFHGDGSDVQFVVALEKHTGKAAWKIGRSSTNAAKPLFNTTYSTPLIMEVGGQPQLISNGADWLYGYDPATGRELWKLAYRAQGFGMSARPVAGLGMVFYSTGFPKPDLQAVRCDGVKPPDLVWDFPKGVPTTSSPLLVDEQLYFVSDGGIVTCVNARTGRQIFRERLGGDFRASPVLADGRLYFSSSEGVTHVLANGKAFEKLAENTLEGRLLSSAAAVDGAFFIRTDKALYRIGARK